MLKDVHIYVHMSASSHSTSISHLGPDDRNPLYSLFRVLCVGFIVPQLLKAAAAPNALRTHHIINAIIIVSHTATRTYSEGRVTLLQDHNPDP